MWHIPDKADYIVVNLSEQEVIGGLTEAQALAEYLTQRDDSDEDMLVVIKGRELDVTIEEVARIVD